MTHLIRPAGPEDVEAAETVRVATWQSAYRGIIADDYLDAMEVDQEQMTLRAAGVARALAEGRTPLLVAEVDGRVVGYVNIGPNRDIGGGHIYAIYVLPEAQSMGLGQALMNAAVAHLRADGHQKIGLWVASANDRTRRFYERFGMAPSGRVTFDEELGIEETHYSL